jgi:[protein-PII] uridylyltransferase
MTKANASQKQLIDSARLRGDLAAIHARHGRSETDLRAAILVRLKEAMAHGRAVAETRLGADGHGTKCAANLSYIQDEIIRALCDFTIDCVYTARNPSAAERLCVVAVGGYGRGTLAPGSDIDLLFVLPYKQTPWGESVVEYMLYILWDLGLKVGHATRSVDECVRLSKSDLTIRTAILEARYLWGDRDLYDDLARRFDEDVVADTAREFIDMKLAERDLRHRRVGRSRYLVEPNVKDGKGGLRDVHTLFWIAKYYYRVQDGRDLVKAGVFTTEEYRKFRKCEDFLWAVRCHLHFLTGRGEDRLSFDHQAEMASRLGYTDRAGLSHVERFMKHYFLVAKDVGDLTRIFCSVLEAAEVKKAPMLSRMMARLRRRKLTGIADSSFFTLDAGRITVQRSTVFEEDPVNLIRLFHLAGRNNMAIHPNALRLVTRSLGLIGKDLRANEEANRLFMETLTSRSDPETTLRKMNEAGVLGRFVLEFGRIVALMQFNMYHHFTVDEHLLRSIGILAEIERGELAGEHPLSHEIIRGIRQRRALYVALFLHDIAKGRREDHSIVGARIARKLGPRLGLTSAETETAAWLVEHHLVMSNFAQMRDLNDFKTILDFCAIVQSPERLKLLLILTVCDIKAVGPGVWNGWKGQLLRTLYHEAEPVLAGGHTAVSRKERVAAAQERFAARFPDWSKKEMKAYLQAHYEPYWLNVDIERQVAHAELVRTARQDKAPVVTAVTTDRFTAVTELTVYTPDHPRLLAILTGACAASGANIVDAQIFTTSTGMALDSILIQREFDDGEDETRRAKKIARTMERALRGEIRLPEMIARQARPRGRIRAFTVEPQVLIDNEGSNIFTVIEVAGLDRPGLLHDLTDALFRLNLNIGSAHIATFGERAVDVFYVRDLTGQKITNGNRQAAIRRHLLAALDPGTGQAAKEKPARRRLEAAQ